MVKGATAGVTRDTLFGGRLIVDQSARGHRAGTDAVLLAAAAPPDLAGRVIDAGAGVGTVGLRIAQLSPKAEVTLLENDHAAAALAEANVEANGLADRVRIAACDLLSQKEVGPFAGEADHVVTNPPFHRADQVRASPDADRRAAHVVGDGGLDAWLDACLALLATNGTLILIHQAEALPAILTCIGPRLGGITTLAVHPRAGQQASRVLVRGRRGSRSPFRIAPPLILHEREGFSIEAEALHRGNSALVW